MSINSNGRVLWEGASLHDGAPIVIIATGFKSASANSKTGDLIQTWILRQDVPPLEAIKTGDDASVCGGCRHRGDGSGKNRSCYVNLLYAPRGIWAAYKRGSYAKIEDKEWETLFTGRGLRIGAYGDACFTPIDIWQRAIKHTAFHNGYTHGWRTVNLAWAALCMASVDTEEEMHEAQALGYRTFRVSPVGETALSKLEIVCPASEEAGKRTTCEACRACGGTSAKARVSIQIAAHGTGKKYVVESTEGSSSAAA